MDITNRVPLIDVHTHILPGIDDGARNIGESESMYRMLRSQGVEKILLTPHFYSDKMPMNKFLEERRIAYETLTNSTEIDSTKVILASETLFSQSLLSYDDLRELCINGKYLLIEFPFETEFSKHVCSQLMRISYQYGITPILAHIERYPYLMRHTDVLGSLIDDGLLTQINLSSLQTFRKRRQVIRLIRKGYVHLIGTDCHHPFNRPPAFEEGLAILKKHLLQEDLEDLLQNAWDILT